jgi:formylglycine-generating enzyme required for sulfatase activity
MRCANSIRLRGYCQWLLAALSAAALLVSAATAQTAATAQPSEASPDDIRAPGADQVWLVGGDRMSGQVLNRAFELRAPYGELRLDRGLVASLEFDAGVTGQVRVLTVSGDRLTGRLQPPEIQFQSNSGERVVLPGEKLSKIVLGRRESGPAGSAAGPPAKIPGFVWIPPGQFKLGTPAEEAGRDPDEGPLTHVTIRQGFWMSQHEVTQAEYQRETGLNPSTTVGDPKRPVEKVNWFEAMDYCHKVTQRAEQEGYLPRQHVVRLPTEAEWEYACRSGTTTRFSYGDDLNGTQLSEYAWFTRNSDSATHPAGSKRPNPWGLFDLHGNVWEWCLDRWEDGLPGGSITNAAVSAKGSLRVARGGSWLYEAKACRSGNRDDYSPWDRCSDIGFRVVIAPVPGAGE